MKNTGAKVRDKVSREESVRVKGGVWKRKKEERKITKKRIKQREIINEREREREKQFCKRKISFKCETKNKKFTTYNFQNIFVLIKIESL